MGDFKFNEMFNGWCVDGASYRSCDYDVGGGEDCPTLLGEERL